MLSVGSPLDGTVSTNTKEKLTAQKIIMICSPRVAEPVAMLLWMDLSVL